MVIGDGVLVDVGEKFPESRMTNPNEFTYEFKMRLFTEIIREIRYVNTLGGNYVTIDHENGEFSFYCNISDNTITVKKGDRVKQGQVIGKVGNTGNSADPHLHFQLMDGPNMLDLKNGQSLIGGQQILIWEIKLNLEFNLMGENKNSKLFILKVMVVVKWMMGFILYEDMNYKDKIRICLLLH